MNLLILLNALKISVTAELMKYLMFCEVGGWGLTVELRYLLFRIRPIRNQCLFDYLMALIEMTFQSIELTFSFQLPPSTTSAKVFFPLWACSIELFF